MRIAVCEDNELHREMIACLLNRYATEKSIPFAITSYQSGINLLYDTEEGATFDIVFLDIYMKDLLGIDVAHRLRGMGYQGHIVFLTATADFAVDGYEVEAMGYLLKPHSFEKLSQVMDRATREMTENFYPIKHHSKVTKVSYHEILYIESSNSKCILHCCNGQSYVIYKKLSEIEQELNDERFLRCHQSYLVNMDYIYKMDRQFTLVTGDIVLIRQRNLKAIRQAALDHMAKKRLDRIPSAKES